MKSYCYISIMFCRWQNIEACSNNISTKSVCQLVSVIMQELWSLLSLEGIYNKGKISYKGGVGGEVTKMLNNLYGKNVK